MATPTKAVVNPRNQLVTTQQQALTQTPLNTESIQRSKAIREALMSGKISNAEAQKQQQENTQKLLQGSQTINRYGVANESQAAAQQQFNQKYNLAPDTGMKGTLGVANVAPAPAAPPVSQSTVAAPVAPALQRPQLKPAVTPSRTAVLPTNQSANALYPSKTGSQFAPDRSKSLLPVGPTSANPMFEVSAAGVNQPRMSISDYMSMSPEEQLMAQQQSQYQSGRMQADLLDRMYGQQENQLQQRESDIQSQRDAAKAQLEERNAAEEAAFKAQLDAQKAQQIAAIQAAQQRSNEAAQQNLAFSGFGRSTKAADIASEIAGNAQAQIAQIEADTGRQLGEYHRSLLEKTDAQLQKYQDRLDKTQSDKDALQVQKLKDQQSLMVDLFKSDPSNPENMLATAQKLQQIQLDKAKASAEEKKAVYDQSMGVFKYMVENFGSDYVRNLDPDSLATLSANTGIPGSVLTNLGKTLVEQKNDWDKLKYVQDQQFDLYKISRSEQFDMQKLAQQQGFDWEKMQASQNFDMQKMLTEKQYDERQKAKKYDNLGYSQNAIGSSGAGYTYSEPVPTIDGKNTAIEYNPNLAGAYPNGYKFSTAGGNGLAGQCAWFGEQLVTLGGKNFTVGSTLAEKKSALQKYAKQGLAYAPGQEEPQVGQSIITNDSKTYGHYAVINGKTPDNKLILTESNFKGPLTVSNTRVIDPNDPRIIGFLKTEPKPQYRVAKNIGRAGEGAKEIANGNVGRGIYDAAAGAIGALNNIGGILPRQQLQPQSQSQQFQQPPQELSPFRQAVRSGATTLSDAQESEFASVDPVGFQQYQSDKMEGQKIKSGKTDFTQANQLYGRYDSTSKEIRTLEQGNAIAKTFNINTQNPYDDQALIFSFMKVLDPTSVVREGEFKTAQNNSSILNSMAAGWQNAATGTGMLTTSQRQNIINAMKGLYVQKMKQYGDLINQYAATGAKMGFSDPSMFLDYTPEYFNQFNQQSNNDPLSIGVSGGSTGGGDPLGLGI